MLVELDGQTGHTENFASVRLDTQIANGNMRGIMTQVRIIASDGQTLTGTAL
jgi:hypothetical protein